MNTLQNQSSAQLTYCWAVEFYSSANKQNLLSDVRKLKSSSDTKGWTDFFDGAKQDSYRFRSGGNYILTYRDDDVFFEKNCEYVRIHCLPLGSGIISLVFCFKLKESAERLNNIFQEPINQYANEPHEIEEINGDHSYGNETIRTELNEYRTSIASDCLQWVNSHFNGEIKSDSESNLGGYPYAESILLDTDSNRFKQFFINQLKVINVSWQSAHSNVEIFFAQNREDQARLVMTYKPITQDLLLDLNETNIHATHPLVCMCFFNHMLSTLELKTMKFKEDILLKTASKTLIQYSDYKDVISEIHKMYDWIYFDVKQCCLFKRQGAVIPINMYQHTDHDGNLHHLKYEEETADFISDFKYSSNQLLEMLKDIDSISSSVSDRELQEKVGGYTVAVTVLTVIVTVMTAIMLVEAVFPGKIKATLTCIGML